MSSASSDALQNEGMHEVPVTGQGAVRDLASAVGQGLRDGKRHWAGQFYGTITVQLRMLYGRSRPVLPPSFMPKLTFQAVGFKNDDSDRVTMHAVNLILFGHHSNGQTDCPLAGQFTDTDGTCQLPNSSNDEFPPLVNQNTGNFSIHYIQASKYYRWIDLSTFRAVLRQRSFGFGIEHHLRYPGGAIDPTLRSRYGPTRLWVVWEMERKRYRVHARGERIFGDGVGKRWGGEIEGIWYLRRQYWPGTGIYLRAYDRQDTYNIRFEAATGRVEVGLKFGWEGGPHVWG